MRKIFGCCFSFIVVIVLFFGIIFGGIWYVSGKTLGELGLGDQVVSEGKTIEDLGLADIRIRDIFSIIGQLRAGIDESDIVTHGYTDDDMNSAKNKLEGSNAYNDETGELDFENMDGEYVIFNDSTPIVFKDTELAALFNYILTEGIDESESEFQLSVREVKITVQEDGIRMRTVLKFDISAIQDQIDGAVPSFAKKYITIGDAIYIITNSDIYADEEGKIKRGEQHLVTLNNIPNELTDPIMELLINVMIEENDFEGIDGEEIEPSPGFFAEMMSGVFAEFVYRFGLVGEDEESLGNSGFATEGDGGSVSIVPWTAETVPVDENYINDAMYDASEALGIRYFIIADIYRYKINEQGYSLDEYSPQGFIDKLNEEEEATFVLGTQPVDGAIVINVELIGSDFFINGVYIDYGPFYCSVITESNPSVYPSRFYTTVTDKSESIDESFTRIEIDEAVADIISESVFYAVSYLSIMNYDDTIELSSVNELINMLNSTYNFNVIEGSAPTTNKSSALNITMDENDDFIYGFASVTTKYGIATITFSYFS